MSFIYQATKTVTFATGSTTVTDTMSTHLNGLITSAYVDISIAVGADTKVIMSAAGTTPKEILTVLNPSSNGEQFYPRVLAQNTTAGVFGTSHGVMIPLAREQVQITVESSSTKSGTVTAIVGVI
jgi:hypothetical protein